MGVYNWVSNLSALELILAKIVRARVPRNPQIMTHVTRSYCETMTQHARLLKLPARSYFYKSLDSPIHCRYQFRRNACMRTPL